MLWLYSPLTTTTRRLRGSRTELLEDGWSLALGILLVYAIQ
jgi:hypothetical protein